MYQTELTSSDLEPFVDGAIAIVSEQGLDALTVRAVADRSGVSPSLISYKFHSKQGLIDTVTNQVRARLERLWNQRQSSLLAQPIDPTSIAGIATGLMVEASYTHREILRAGWAFDVHRLRATTTPPQVPDERGAESFWSMALKQAGGDPGHGRWLAAALDSVGHILLTAPPAADRIAWCSDTVQRLFERLTGKVRKRPMDSAWRTRFVKARGLRPTATTGANTRQTIIDTAKAIITQDGYRALSHRRIAHQGGVSLSSTTHHFSTLDDIIVAAFWAIFDEAALSAKAIKAAAHPGSLEAYIDRVLPAIGAGSRSSGMPVTVMEELILLSSQREDMQSLGLSLFARMGDTTFAMLEPLASRDRFTRLDAHIFRHCLRGMVLHGGAGAKILEDSQAAAFLKTLFATRASG